MAGKETSAVAAADIAAQSDTGARDPHGFQGRLIIGVAFVWALFQLYYASPLPYVVGVAVLNSTEVRSIHLAFAIFLAYLAYPALKRSPRDYIPIQDWVLALVAAFCAASIFLLYRQLSLFGFPGPSCLRNFSLRLSAPPL